MYKRLCGSLNANSVLFYLFFKYLFSFIWLLQINAPGLSCGTQDLESPDQGSNLGPLHWELGFLATGPQVSPNSVLFYMRDLSILRFGYLWGFWKQSLANTRGWLYICKLCVETRMQVKKQQLEMDMEQQTGSKLGMEYIKTIYCHPVYLTYMQSTSWETLGWMKQPDQECWEKYQ